MASNVVTANPRKLTARSAPPPRTISSDSLEKGTVLLRNPLPKYSFEKKYTKEKKQSTESKDKSSGKDAAKSGKEKENVTNITQESAKQATVTDNKEAVISNVSSSPGNVEVPANTERVGRLVMSFPQTMASPDFAQSEDQSAGKSKAEKPVNKVDPFSSDSKNLKHSVSAPAINQQRSQTAEPLNKAIVTHSPNTMSGGTIHSSIGSSGTSQDSSVLGVSDNNVAQSAQDVPAANIAIYEEKINSLGEEKQLLKNQLDVQLQVNQELKKLLVASVGEDLHRRVERLMTERAQLSLELGDFSKKMTEDYEHLDQISIQADMWRSKYMACRVMADELASSKAFYSMQFQEAQMALQQLLSERHEVRANLYEAYRGLQQIQEAFDPLNTQSSTMKTLTSKHIIDLARTNQLLVDRIKYRLLPSHVTSSLNNKMEHDWHDYLTQAEAHAQQLLSRELRPEDFRCLPMSAIMAPGCMAVDRYHPCANFDNLTLNVCCKCKGEIRVV